MIKIILATRTDKDDLVECKEKLANKFGEIPFIKQIYIVCNQKKNNKFQLGNVPGEIIPDGEPLLPTAFNGVLKKLNENKEERYHFLAYSKEVDLREKNIEKMIEEVESDEDLIAVGYHLRDNVLSDKEQLLYERGIAYKIPWNTCALWNKRFVYGKGNKKLWFDEICEKDKNQFGELRVKVNGLQIITDYEGMEDGLAIAELVSKNGGLKYKLIGDNYLSWFIDGDEKRKLKQKVKMARKSIVLATFLAERGFNLN